MWHDKTKWSHYYCNPHCRVWQTAFCINLWCTLYHILWPSRPLFLFQLLAVENLLRQQVHVTGCHHRYSVITLAKFPPATFIELNCAVKVTPSTSLNSLQLYKKEIATILRFISMALACNWPKNCPVHFLSCFISHTVTIKVLSHAV